MRQRTTTVIFLFRRFQPCRAWIFGPDFPHGCEGHAVAAALDIVAARTEGQQMRDHFRQSIQMAGTYRRGEPITLRYEIQNISDDEYALLVWETPLEREVFRFVEVRRGDRRVPYDGRLVKRGDPTAESYRTIAAGQTIVEELDLSKYFAFEEFGTYTVTLHTRFLDAIRRPSANDAPRRRYEHESFSLDPVSASFELVPDGSARMTVGQHRRQQQAARSRLDPSDQAGHI